MARASLPNSRMASIEMSGGIREILAKADQMELEGRSVIHMEIGRPDFDSPLCAKNAVIKALNDGNVHYTDMSGAYDLRCAVANKYRSENKMEISADDIIITCGAMEALLATFLAILEPGDEILVPAPYFSAYADEIAISNAVLVPVMTKMENGFRLKPEDLKKACSNRTKAILLNSPNNPSGAVFTRQDLEAIAAFAIENDIWVISDECYEKFLYEGEHVSIGSLPGMGARTITISSASKTWSMTGWRVGWIVACGEVRKYINKCHQNITSCANSFAQAGVVEAFANGNGDVEKMIAEYRRRRDMVVRWLNNIKGVEAITPAGAFYAFPRISSFGMDGFTFCSWLLEEAGVSTVPGEVFGMPGHIRLAYCRSYEYIEEGLKRIKDLVEHK